VLWTDAKEVYPEVLLSPEFWILTHAPALTVLDLKGTVAFIDEVSVWTVVPVVAVKSVFVLFLVVLDVPVADGPPVWEILILSPELSLICHIVVRGTVAPVLAIEGPVESLLKLINSVVSQLSLLLSKVLPVGLLIYGKLVLCAVAPVAAVVDVSTVTPVSAVERRFKSGLTGRNVFWDH